MTTHRLYQIDAFTTTRFEGNPAGVVPDADGLSEAQMQALARELGNPETAFVLSPDAPDHDVHLRYFTPTTEVPSCGHATIAAHYALALEAGLSAPRTVVQKTAAGLMPIETIPEGSDYQVVMTQGRIEIGETFGSATETAVLEALGLTVDDRDGRCPMQIASTGHSKVMVGIGSRETLDGLRPDLDRLRAISGEIGCNGYYVFVLDEHAEVLIHGRMFAPAIGIAEDPVTGNANGPLGAYLVRHRIVPAPQNDTFRFQIRQGEALGRPGGMEVRVEVEDGEPRLVRVVGGAVVVFRTEVEVVGIRKTE